MDSLTMLEFQLRMSIRKKKKVNEQEHNKKNKIT